jgi:hypothetical protein
MRAPKQHEQQEQDYRQVCVIGSSDGFWRALADNVGGHRASRSVRRESGIPMRASQKLVPLLRLQIIPNPSRY